MAFKCDICFHLWVGCKCVFCGEIRDKQHDWSQDCEKCSKCNKTIESNHIWDGFNCTKCGKVGFGKYRWSKDIYAKAINDKKVEIKLKLGALDFERNPH